MNMTLRFGASGDLRDAIERLRASWRRPRRCRRRRGRVRPAHAQVVEMGRHDDPFVSQSRVANRGGSAPTLRPMNVPGSLPGIVWTYSPSKSGSSLRPRKSLDEVGGGLLAPRAAAGRRTRARRASRRSSRSRAGSGRCALASCARCADPAPPEAKPEATTDSPTRCRRGLYVDCRSRQMPQTTVLPRIGRVRHNCVPSGMAKIRNSSARSRDRVAYLATVWE